MRARVKSKQVNLTAFRKKSDLFVPASRITKKVSKLLREKEVVVILDPDRLIQEFQSINVQLRDVMIKDVKGDLELRKVINRFKGDKLVLVDQSRQGVFVPDLLVNTRVGFLNIDVKQFLEEETGREWPLEVRAFPFKQIVRKKCEGFLETYHRAQRKSKLSLSREELRRLAASAVLRMDLFDSLTLLRAWELATQRNDEWEELSSYFGNEKVGEIQESLQWREPMAADLFDLKQRDTARRALAGCLLLWQYLSDPQNLLPLLDPSFHPFMNLNPDSLKIDDGVPLWVVDEVKLFEADLASQAWDIISNRLKLEDLEGIRTVLGTEEVSANLRKLATLKAIELSLKDRKISKTLALVEEVPFPSEDRALKDLKILLNSVKDAQVLLDTLASDLRMLLQKDPQNISWEELCEVYINHSIHLLEVLLWRIRNRSGKIGFGGEEHPSWVPSSVKVVKESARRLLREGLAELTKLERVFQGFIESHYPKLISGGTPCTLRFTEDFLLPRLRKGASESGVQVLLFDGMRFDVWRQIVRPVLEERYSLVDEAPGIAMLPSVTSFSRKASYSPLGHFRVEATEMKLLSETLSVLGKPVEVVEQSKPSEVVSQALRTKDGRVGWMVVDITDRLPHDFPYNLDSLFRIIEALRQEVTTAVNAVPASAEILVLSDHGFTQTGDRPIQVSLDKVSPRYAFFEELPSKEERRNMIIFERKQLGLEGSGYVAFPKVGYYFLKKGGHTKRSRRHGHGGISVGEMIIPFARLIPSELVMPRVEMKIDVQPEYKAKEEGRIAVTVALEGVFEEEIDLNSNIKGFKTRKMHLKKGTARQVEVLFTPSKPGMQTVVFEAKKDGKTLGRTVVRVRVLKPGRVERLGEEKIRKLFEGE